MSAPTVAAYAGRERPASCIEPGDTVTCLDTGETGYVVAKMPQLAGRRVRARFLADPTPPLAAGDGCHYHVQRGGYIAVYGRHQLAPGPSGHRPDSRRAG